MMSFPGPQLLSAAILTALAGSAMALDPQLDITGAAADIPLGEVRFTPSSKLLYARSLAGNFQCGNPTTPATGSMQLDLDGVRYQIAEPTSGNPISYAPGTGTFAFGLLGDLAGACASTGATVMDFVAMGANGQPTARSRIGQAVHFQLPGTAPTVPADITLMDSIRCESYGSNPTGIDVAITDANGQATDLLGAARFEYDLTVVNGRRELRMYPQLATSGIQRVQCTSPGLAFGPDAAGAVPGRILFSGFEAVESFADVVLSVAGGWLDSTGQIVKIADGSDGARVELTVFNPARTAASNVRVREYLRTSAVGTPRVVEGVEPAACTPIPAESTACTSLPDDLDYPISFQIPSLAAGEGIRLTLHRQLADMPAAQDGVAPPTLQVGYAAFVDPEPTTGAPDGMLGNNAKWVDFAVS